MLLITLIFTLVLSTRTWTILRRVNTITAQKNIRKKPKSYYVFGHFTCSDLNIRTHLLKFRVPLSKCVFCYLLSISCLCVLIIADTNYYECNDIGNTALDYEILLISINFINIYNVTDYFQPLHLMHLCYLPSLCCVMGAFVVPQNMCTRFTFC